MNTNSKKNDSLLEYFTIIHILCIHENTNNFFLIRFLLNPTPQRTFIFYDIIIIIIEKKMISSHLLSIEEYHILLRISFHFIPRRYLYRRTGTEQQHGTRREKEEEDEGEEGVFNVKK